MNNKNSFSSCRIGWLQVTMKKSDDEDFKNIQEIDLSGILTSDLEPLTSTSNKFRRNDKSNQRMTGDIGEEMVYKYLQKKYSEAETVLIKWENENDESNLPYDILLIEKRKKYYIEVKSTRKNNEHSFSLTMNEMKSIFEYRKFYSIYRVYIDEKKLIILTNIEQCLQEQHLSCSLTINPHSLNKTS